MWNCKSLIQSRDYFVIMADIDKLSWRYFKQSICISAFAYFVGLILVQVLKLWSINIPLIVSAVFSLVFTSADALIWRAVAKKSPESLTTFYTAVSGFRMLLALATMFVYYIICGRESMLEFFLVFMSFYVIHLVHHSVYFARLSNRS